MQAKCSFLRCAGLALAAAAMILCRGLPLCAGEEVDRVVATVDGDPITLEDVRSFATQTGNQIGRAHV